MVADSLFTNKKSLLYNCPTDLEGIIHTSVQSPYTRREFTSSESFFSIQRNLPL